MIMIILHRRVPWMSVSTVAARRPKVRRAQHHRSLRIRGPTVPTDRLPEQDISANTTLELPGREELCGTFQRPLFHRSPVTAGHDSVTFNSSWVLDLHRLDVYTQSSRGSTAETSPESQCGNVRVCIVSTTLVLVDECDAPVSSSSDAPDPGDLLVQR